MENTKKERVLVFGASPNPERYAYKATEMLQEYGHEVIGFGRKPGPILGAPVVHDLSEVGQVDTVTIYMGAAGQDAYLESIVKLKPKRIIFNPGAENNALAQMAIENGIEPTEACTLVLLRTGQY